MTREDYVGLHVARWREIAGLTQQQLADTVGVTREYISMIENGARAVTKRSLLVGLADALGVTVTDLLNPPSESRFRSAEDMVMQNAAASVRKALDGGSPDRPRAADELTSAAEGVIVARMQCDYPTLARELPKVIAEARELANNAPEQRVRYAGLDALVKACVFGSFAMKTIGEVDLAMRLAERAQTAAGKLGRPVHAAAARMAIAQVLMATGLREQALNVALTGAHELQDHLDCNSGRAWYGELHLQAALSSASLGRASDAATHLNEADETAQHTVTDSWHREMTPANVAIWRIGVALENGEPERAPEYARRVDPTQVHTPQRLARLHIDSGRGYYAIDKPDLAVRSFLRADDISPQEVRRRGAVREIVGQIVRDARRGTGSEELRVLAGRLGINPLTSD